MESNIKGLVTAGHEMASELKAECGAVDMRSVAKLISDLATQLEVQLVRANALAEDQQKAIESIKQADAAVKLAHEKFSALAAENAGIKSAIPESRDIEDDNDNMDDVSLAEDFGFNHAIERMRRQIPETPTTDAFLAEVRAQGVDAAIEAAKNLVAQEYEYKDFKAAQSDCCMYPGSDLVGKVEMTEWLVDFAAQLRKGGNQ
ncbi:TPA: eae-like domain protein [Escherichia coli]|uniref:ead/Ea22-like family protein n=1 Tax=Escherichia coli TaxID=562 RepID=UPI0017E13745|nr:ead/Ea22-like family protein [Escherichia coli]EFA6619986.1 eae-like domain protein [Escherichia coli]EFA6640838.1 eae-like domain protein [Escherichia coli]EFO0648232.1 eae-like domain protein [Escherichia coli]MBE3156152.1 eae-like domain protein [Escherichia coli]HBB6469383.1 eae-like domain protein [Escherichia coli]